MKGLRANIYRAIYYWALHRWRKTLNNYYIGHQPKSLTMHAKIRYMERVEGYNYSGLAKRILTEEVKAKANELGGDGKFQIDGVIYVFVDHKLVTVYKAEGLQKNIVQQSHDRKVWSF